jgi:hypothetical protein
MKKVTVVLVLAIVLGVSVVSAFAQQSVAGAWEMSIQGMSMPMVLSQDGEKVSGTIDSPHGIIPMRGDFSKGKLTLTGDATDSHSVDISVSATLNSDGTLSGTMAAFQMEMGFTAVKRAGK